ncbi:endolytic transglycosylase MltG [Allosphingosinicella flava]|uniref:Endolytic murein transglycosylase n=1 Tax=Allosphingosinicella flava TaxID=2771430 RepID=A0A7T2GLA0_9SPHN|nr:endolytic transglycosylase MltG [Sphingosinicella flava]QPQ55939.1 endolytic transglycosylase MltG [Sphingosinicella flava]
MSVRVKALLAYAALILAVLAVGFVVKTWWGEGPMSRDRNFVVEQGATLTGTARKLEEKGLIRSAGAFTKFAAVLGSSDPVRAGEFTIPAGASGSQILDILQHAQPIRRLVTIPEGMPSILVHERLRGEARLVGPVPIPAEGSVLPDSYSYESGETRAAVLKRMQDAMTKELDRLWAGRKPGSVVKSKAEAITLASIVEKETGKPSERRMVAGVYSNRLRIGMKLDADPTVIYPITKGKPLGRRILRSELQAKNGYNTYASPGLPVGPIANPGRESIAAVLDPAPTKALYFVADGTGGHIFADTLEQHNANVRKWYEIRRARGEM